MLLKFQFSFSPSSDKMVRLTSNTSVCSTYILILNSSLSKIKLLNKELVALREAGEKAAESLQSAEAVNAELEDRLQRRDWELRDLAAVKDARCGVSPSPCGRCGQRARCLARSGLHPGGICLFWLIPGRLCCSPLPAFSTNI